MLRSKTTSTAEGSVSIRVVTDKELQGHIESILASSILHKGTHGWMRELEGFSRSPQAHLLICSIAIPARLWNDNSVTSTGNGHVRIEPALQDESFRPGRRHC
jgi:hypothetical protein